MQPFHFIIGQSDGPCGKQNDAPQDIYILIPRTYEYVMCMARGLIEGGKWGAEGGKDSGVSDLEDWVDDGHNKRNQLWRKQISLVWCVQYSSEDVNLPSGNLDI